jgi:nicotinate-nucleotide--dimethylbenzimidazole phosphoribosyltransferase
MEIINNAIASIKPIDKEMHEKALERLSNQARPSGSLGILEPLSARLAAVKGCMDVRLEKKVIVTCAGDHGVVEEGVSLFPQEVTAQMVYNFVNGGASISVLARHAGATVKVADIGVAADFDPNLPIFHKKIAKGTKNFAKEPAMTREEAVRSVVAGIEIVDCLVNEERMDIIGTGDMGIGNTTPSSAIIAAFSGFPAEQLTGRGTGIGDQAFLNKIRVIDNAIKLHKPDPNDPMDVLSKVGGFEIGGLAGLVIGAAKYGIPVVCDGLISTAGALLACEIAPAAKDYLFVSHKSVEAGHTYMHRHLGLHPILDLGFRLGEGTGAALAMEILDASTRVLNDIKTFDEVGIRNANQ